MSMIMKTLLILLVECLSVNAFLRRDCKEIVESKKNISADCSKQLHYLCDNKDVVLKLWDSSARIFDSGIFEASTMYLGNFDLCMTIDENQHDVNLLGKYCLGAWGTEILPDLIRKYAYYVELRKLPDFKMKQEEPVLITGSLCIPNDCSVKEFTKVFHPYFYPVNFSVADESNCATKYSPNQLSSSELIITICFGILAVTLISCTICHIVYEYMGKRQPPDIIKAFSIKHNGEKLMTINKNTVEQFQCVNGLRFWSIIWIIAGHSFTMNQGIPLINHAESMKWLNNLYSQYINAAHFAVDTFFFLSGFLLAFGYLKVARDRSVSRQIKGIPLMYLSRYFRLTPSIAALFLISISFLKVLGSGPFWLNGIGNMSTLCKKYWWRYFLYIQNYYSDKDYCYIQTWYLSADMQMFILSPIVLIPMTIFFKKNLRPLIWVLSGLAVVCMTISILIVYLADYTNGYDTHSRLSNYLIGIICGIVMYRNKGKHVKISKILNICLWVVSLATMLGISLYMFDVLQHPSTGKTALFYPIGRTIWCVCIFWIVFSCYFGYGGSINEFLSLPAFQIGARLSYSMYVIHMSVIISTLGNLRSFEFFSNYKMFLNVSGVVVTTMLVSVIWTLAFESPMILLTKMLISRIESLLTKEKPKG